MVVDGRVRGIISAIIGHEAYERNSCDRHLHGELKYKVVYREDCHLIKSSRLDCRGMNSRMRHLCRSYSREFMRANAEMLLHHNYGYFESVVNRHEIS